MRPAGLSLRQCPIIVFVRKGLPADSLNEFTDYAKAKGRDLKMGHSGPGTISHITCVLLFQLIGTQPTYVTYRGYGQTINDILSGSIDGSCDLVTSASGQVSAGTVKAFAVAADERSPAVPEVPTAKEMIGQRGTLRSAFATSSNFQHMRSSLSGNCGNTRYRVTIDCGPVWLAYSFEPRCLFRVIHVDCRC